MNTLEVFPGKGLGPLRFGMSITEVEQVQGVAAESYMEEDGAYSYRVLSYPKIGISLFFRESYGFRLSSAQISLTLQDITLFGESLHLQSKSQVVQLLQSNLPGYAMSEIREDAIKSLRQQSLWVPAIGGMFYFNRVGIVQEVQWSPLLDPDGEPIWQET